MAHPFPDTANLADFIAATAGRRGAVSRSAAGTLVASPVAVSHSFVNAAVLTDADARPERFLDTARSFFAAHQRTFVLWLPEPATDHVAHVVAAGYEEIPRGTAMSIEHEVAGVPGIQVEQAVSPEQIEVFGRVAEAGFESPGLAWLYDRHDAYAAEGSAWFVAFRDGEPVGTACSFLTGTIGGIYNVATPPAARGRGVGAATTAAAVNHLLVTGARTVVLQASAAGRPVYERLGFATHGRYRRFEVLPS
jgi:GNAT superfamily N-acetyltransferase